MKTNKFEIYLEPRGDLLYSGWVSENEDLPFSLNHIDGNLELCIRGLTVIHIPKGNGIIIRNV